jgi:hypothetical protein
VFGGSSTVSVLVFRRVGVLSNDENENTKIQNFSKTNLSEHNKTKMMSADEKKKEKRRE